MARRAEQIGVRKAGADTVTVLLLSVLAGAFIALGALFATTTLTGSSAPPYGVARLLGGLAFTLGVTLVIVGGAELFTGNNLIVMAWPSRKMTTLALLRNWALVYLGNFTGSVATAARAYGSGQYTFANGQVGATTLAIASARPVAPIDYTKNLTAPVLGIFGTEDQNPSPAQVDQHEAEPKKHGKAYEFHRHDGAGHGFFHYDRPPYRQQQAMDGWENVFTFFATHLA